MVAEGKFSSPAWVPGVSGLLSVNWMEEYVSVQSRTRDSENTSCKHLFILVLQVSTYTESQAMCSFCKPLALPLPSPHQKHLFQNTLQQFSLSWQMEMTSAWTFAQFLTTQWEKGTKLLKDSMADRSDWNENLKCFGVGSITLFDVV